MRMVQLTKQEKENILEPGLMMNDKCRKIC